MFVFRVNCREGASEAVLYAAGELTRYLTSAGAVSAANAGHTFTLREGVPGLAGGAFRRTVTGNDVLIESEQACGIVYGCYDLLEDMGFRFLARDCDVIPDTLSLPPEGVHEESPAFVSREEFWREAMDGDYAVRLRLNSARSSIEPRHGGKMMFYNFSHTFDQLVPVEKWYPDHPEYFSMVNGKRLRERTQLCLSNPDVLRLCIAGVRKWVEDHPDHRIFSVSMNDWYNACECPACRAVDEEEGGQSGSVIRFVNAVADAIGKDHPDVMIHTFAYLYCRKPPRITRPRDNVIVRLCSIECCFSHPIRECRKERGGIDVQNGSAVNFSDAAAGEGDFISDLHSWSQVCKNLFIWDYTTNYANYLLPFPNLNVLQENLRMFRDEHVTGVFEQGNFSHGRSSALAQLKIYLLGKLLWDPDEDMDRLIADFVHGYYGAAGDVMGRYVELWRTAPGPHHVGIYDMPDSPWMTDGLLESAEHLLRQALELTQGTAAYERVEREALSVRYAMISREDPAQEGHAERVDRFMEDIQRLGITELFERKELHASAELLKRSRYTVGRKEVPGITYPI